VEQRKIVRLAVTVCGNQFTIAMMQGLVGSPGTDGRGAGGSIA
jgi:hypothetical protein